MQTAKRRSAKPLKIALVCVLVVILGTTTVFAGTAIYSLLVKQNGDYGASISVTPQPDTDEWKYVNIAFDYIPEGMIMETDISYYYPVDDGKSDYYNGFCVCLFSVKSDFEIPAFYVGECKELTVNGNRAVLMNITYTEEDSCYESYLYFENSNLLLQSAFSGEFDESEIIKILSGVRLSEGTQFDCMFDFSNDKAQQLPVSPCKDSVKNYNREIKIGQQTELRNQNESGEKYLWYTVDDAQIFDNVSSLDSRNFTEPPIGKISDYIDKSGNVKPYMREYYEFGDGVNTIDKLIKTERADRKFVLVTLTVENKSEEAQHFGLSLDGVEWLKHNGEGNLDSAQNVINGLSNYGETISYVYADDYTDITLPYHSKRTIKLGYFVDADALDELYFIINTDYRETADNVQTDYAYIKLFDGESTDGQ